MIHMCTLQFVSTTYTIGNHVIFVVFDEDGGGRVNIHVDNPILTNADLEKETKKKYKMYRSMGKRGVVSLFVFYFIYLTFFIFYTWFNNKEGQSERESRNI